jgi:hypothetical protein
MCSNAGHQKREQGSRTAAKFFFVRRIVEELPSSQNQKMRGVRNPSQPMQAGTLERVIVLLSELRAGVAVRDVAACVRSEAANDSAEHEQLDQTTSRAHAFTEVRASSKCLCSRIDDPEFGVDVGKRTGWVRDGLRISSSSAAVAQYVTWL